MPINYSDDLFPSQSRSRFSRLPPRPASPPLRYYGPVIPLGLRRQRAAQVSAARDRARLVRSRQRVVRRHQRNSRANRVAGFLVNMRRRGIPRNVAIQFLQGLRR